MPDLEKVIKGLECCMKWTGEPNTATCHCSDCSYTNTDILGQRCLIDLINDAISLLKEQKAKTGHWIEKEDYNLDTYYDCSVCGESWTMIDGTPWENGMNYCPHCGARMINRG